jgi:hypothetical protein
MSEVLLTCPDCGQHGFYPRGLKAHRGNLNCQRRNTTRVEIAAGFFPSPMSKDTPSPVKTKPTGSTNVAVVFNDSKLTAAALLTKFQAATIDAIEQIARFEKLNIERRLGVGIALRIVKASLPHGQFTTWLKANVKEAGYTQCTYMMRLAETFVEEVGLGRATVKAIGEGKVSLKVKEKGRPTAVQKAATEFIGGLTWGELLMKHDIKADPKKKAKDEPAGDDEPAPAKTLSPEEQYEQSRDELGSLIDRAETLLLKENRLQHLAGHPEEIAGVVAGLRDLATKVEAAAGPLIKPTK